MNIINKAIPILIGLLFILISLIISELSLENQRLISANHKLIKIMKHEDQAIERKAKSSTNINKVYKTQKLVIAKIKNLLLFLNIISLIFIVVFCFSKEVKLIYKIIIPVMMVYFIIFFRFGYNI